MENNVSDSAPAGNISAKEENLLRLIRELGFGELHIYVADGQPVRAEEVKKSIKF